MVTSRRWADISLSAADKSTQASNHLLTISSKVTRYSPHDPRKKRISRSYPWQWVLQDPDQRHVAPKPCPLTLRVLWLGRRTEWLMKRAIDAVRLAYPASKVRAVYSTNRAFRLPKEGLPTHKQSILIYSFECRQCESRYVGQTQQRFCERIKQHVPRHILDSVHESMEKRRGRPPKKRENRAEEYSSAFACHLAANKECCLTYDDSDFRVLAHCRSKHHLNILEAMYLKPVLCRQKSFVANLTLFKHAHSTHSHKHTELSVTHVHTSTPFTHIHTTLTIKNLVFTLRRAYNRVSSFVLFIPLCIHLWFVSDVALHWTTVWQQSNWLRNNNYYRLQQKGFMSKNHWKSGKKFCRGNFSSCPA